MKKKILQTIPVVLFLTMIFTLAVWSHFKPDEAISELENRTLADMPEFTWASLMDGSFGSAYETYLSDQFVMRGMWISLKSSVEAALGKQDIKDVYLADNDYLIRRYTDADFDAETVDKNIAELCKFVKNTTLELGEDHVKVVMIPTAAAVLTDYLPAHATQFDEAAVIARLKDGMAVDNLVDTTDTLKAHSGEYIYFKNDHHWTALGAYYGYAQWADSCGITPMALSDFQKETVTEDFYGTNQSRIVYGRSPDSIDIYQAEGITYRLSYDRMLNQAETVSDTLYARANLEKKDQYTIFLDGNHAIVDIETSVKNGKSLLVVKDSYAHAMLPFIVNHFEHVTVVDTRYYNLGVQSLGIQENYTDVLVIHNTAKFMLDATAFMLNV